ncbi:MAG: monovalent cation/H+ antiporter subunit D family protein [Deltaproteobacteria bacterium]|nr:monovalent cation/H+ antiporter subunit D family protein [Deltaproteobacteria bacterium]MBW1954910.1 monovalent cation/H+ antiporter subunit D family protein [Deltaproteobacteria bacterium]MBW2041294.1 monovalent cation/H+ antiporter subunit D family protein [Deltaproteobacteria bacterium]MBW2131232.1 monovalent cation/H+ antiporter subunit D family protein [Deltaproteobacteria bacterium]
MDPNQPISAILVVLIPLLTAFAVPIIGFWRKNLCFYAACTALAAAFWCALHLLIFVHQRGPVDYFLGGWDPPWGIALRIDSLNALMGVLVTFLFSLTGIASKKSVPLELPLKEAPFYALFLLLFTGLLGMILTGDMFNLYVFLEVSSLTAYALIAMGEPGAMVASFRYLLMGTVGASWYLLGVGYLYIVTGTLNMADLSGLLREMEGSHAVLSGFAFILFGIAIKMALFPLHLWLPDAYAKAPSIVSTTIAPIMTKVMAYVLIRIGFTVFHPEYVVQAAKASGLLVWFGILAILFGGISALSQTDFKRMLAFIIVAEVGYIVGGIGIANPTALKGAIFHIVNDAVMMASLFLVGMMVTHRTGGHGINHFFGIFRKMPLTAIVFTIGALAVIGVPPTCGFFSKWYLLLGGIEAGHWAFVAALLVCTLINVALFFRVFDKGLYLHAKAPQSIPEPRIDALTIQEAPLGMLVVGGILAAGILAIGIGNSFIVKTLILPAVPGGL